MRRGLFLTLSIVLTALLLTATGLFYLFTVDLVVKETQARGFEAIARIQDAIESTPATYQQIARKVGIEPGEHVVVVDSRFMLLADSFISAPVSGRYINAVILDAKEHREATSTVRNRNNRGLSVSVARLVHARSREIIISLTFTIEEITRLSRWFFLWLGSLLAIVSGLIAVGVIYAVKRYRRPIRRLLQNTKEAAASGFSRIAADSDDPELTELLDQFNSLVEHYNLIIETDNKKYSRISTLLSNLRTGILMVDTDNTVTLVNPKAEELLDLDRIELFKRPNAEAVHNELVSEILRETSGVNETGLTRELTLTSPTEEILDITIETITNKYAPFEESGALVIVRDVTEMRRLEKLKDQFISNVSHELRTPLTVIGGFAQTLKDWQSLSQEDRDTAVEIIEIEANRLKKLISELLLLSRIAGEMGENPKERFNPLPAIREVVTSLEPFAEERGIVTTTSFPSTPPMITGVKSWFRQVIVNLYDNAIKYTPRGGSVAISVFGSESSLNVTVSDSGPGIDEHEREKVFERFYQINKSETSKNSGSGLGLAIVKHMIEELGGSIEISDAAEGGACFHITIPKDEQ